MTRRWSDQHPLIARVKVIVTALPTRAIALAGIVAALIPLACELLPGHAEDIARIGGWIVTGLTAAVTIIRKVTPVPADQVGVLPPS
jgi:Na+/H+-translocating membrane pyrophosphatase